MTTTLLMTAVRLAENASLIPASRHSSRNFMQRARRAYKRNVADRGDSAGDTALLLGLAIAQAEIGIHAGWIPEVQKLGCEIAKLIDWRFGPVARTA